MVEEVKVVTNIAIIGEHGTITLEDLDAGKDMGTQHKKVLLTVKPESIELSEEFATKFVDELSIIFGW